MAIIGFISEKGGVGKTTAAYHVASPERRVPVEQALAIVADICRGLEYAHGRDVVNRDLKPSNVWLTAPEEGSESILGAAKIGDFGLATSFELTRLTQSGTVVGTLHFMSPEQATGGEVTGRSDLFSLGCMLYEMVCGRPPFIGNGPRSNRAGGGPGEGAVRGADQRGGGGPVPPADGG